jgi:hypothetical protein
MDSQTWDQFKNTIRELYLFRNITLEELEKIMVREYDFVGRYAIWILREPLVYTELMLSKAKHNTDKISESGDSIKI